MVQRNPGRKYPAAPTGATGVSLPAESTTPTRWLKSALPPKATDTVLPRSEAMGQFLPHAPAVKSLSLRPRTTEKSVTEVRFEPCYPALRCGGCDPIGDGQMTIVIGRRQFISAFGGAAAAWPLAARAQQPERMRRIGVLMGLAADNPSGQARYAAFLQGLQQLDWTEGRNVRIDARWAAGNAAEMRKNVTELVALAPDAILAEGSTSLGPLLQATRSVPIVFVIVPDPVGAGFVDSLSRPGGNATGFMMFEYSLSEKWLQLLKEIAPGVTRAAVLRDPTLTSGIGQFAVIQAVAPLVGVDVSPIDVRDAAEIERAVAAFARSGNSGLIVTASALSVDDRDLIITLAARHQLPTVYFERFFVAGGGLISYGPNFLDQFRQAAGYVDRILKGEKPADLPVQAQTKYELVVNLKTAKALGLTIPPTVLARADEVIE
jgi:putative ABC transport system substrate-binding protein